MWLIMAWLDFQTAAYKNITGHLEELRKQWGNFFKGA